MRKIKGKTVPVAVIFSLKGGHFEESKRVLGVGLDYLSQATFTSKGSSGYKMNFLPNQCIVINQLYSPEKNIHLNSGFTGDFDGRNNSSGNWNFNCI